MAEQRYKAVIGDGRAIREVADAWGVSRQTLHEWLARYEIAGLEGLVDRSHRPVSCPHQMPAVVEVTVLELRRGPLPRAQLSADPGPPRVHYWAELNDPRWRHADTSHAPKIAAAPNRHATAAMNAARPAWRQE